MNKDLPGLQLGMKYLGVSCGICARKVYNGGRVYTDRTALHYTSCTCPDSDFADSGSLTCTAFFVNAVAVVGNSLVILIDYLKDDIMNFRLYST